MSTTKSLEELKKEVVDHWEEMITWVELQNKNDRVNYGKMLDAIKQSWSGRYCSFCTAYSNCSLCPITLKYKGGCSCIGWSALDSSLTWGEWLTHARPFLKKLKAL